MTALVGLPGPEVAAKGSLTSIEGRLFLEGSFANAASVSRARGLSLLPRTSRMDAWVQ